MPFYTTNANHTRGHVAPGASTVLTVQLRVRPDEVVEIHLIADDFVERTDIASDVDAVVIREPALESMQPQ